MQELSSLDIIFAGLEHLAEHEQQNSEIPSLRQSQQLLMIDLAAILMQSLKQLRQLQIRTLIT